MQDRADVFTTAIATIVMAFVVAGGFYGVFGTRPDTKVAAVSVP